MPSEKAHAIQLAKMAEAFIKAGADVELVVPKRRVASQDLKESYGLEMSIPARRLWVLDTYSLGRLGFLLASFSFILAYFFYFLSKRFAGERTILYTTDLDQFSFAPIPFLGMPYFVEIHDAKTKSILFRILFRRAKGIIVINKIIKEKISARFRIPEEKIIVHPNGIDLEQFGRALSKVEAREKLGLPLDAKLVLYTGQFYEWKGLEILGKVAPELPPKAILYLVGGTEEEYEKITDERASGNMAFAGLRDYKEMPLWLKAADVLVLIGTKRNEYSYYHTSPMKLFEYMASGRPIVASRTPANREIVSDEEVIFYEPDDAEDLARKVKNLLEHPAEFQEKIGRAYKKANMFSWEDRARSIMKFMKSRL